MMCDKPPAGTAQCRRLLPGILFCVFFTAWGIPAFAGDPHTPYGRVLQQYVRLGLVDYAALKQKRAPLDAYLAALGDLDPAVYRRWERAEQIAFWLNAYNALTLKVILDHYPIQSGGFRTLVYPSNSIRQIPGVWDRITHRILGRELTLDQIEHEILRKEFREPRIHLALVCAAMGCPPLRDEPYAGKRLETQLDDQARRFFSDPRHLRWEAGERTLRVSSIFQWFGRDFAPPRARPPEIEQAVVRFVAPHLPPPVRREVEAGPLHLRYLPYDWSLNDQRGGTKQ
jgi:hypothetical protein